jgi:hypothetical protein
MDHWRATGRLTVRLTVWMIGKVVMRSPGIHRRLDVPVW